ncbi:MAG: hypothetical protein ACTSUS_10190 [Candidatus Freyarchaeota archaeon]
MKSSGEDYLEAYLTTPLKREDGSTYLSGRMHTARDMAHIRTAEHLEKSISPRTLRKQQYFTQVRLEKDVEKMLKLEGIP